MRIQILLLIFYLSLPAKATDSWWLDAEFEAKGKMIFNLPVKQIDPSFDAVSLLTSEKLEKRFPEAGKDLTDNRALFSIEFDRGSRKHHAVVGVYQGKSESGRFLLILEKSRSKPNWKKIFLFKSPGKKGFGALFKNDSDLLYNDCLECGHGTLFIWNKKTGYEIEKAQDLDDY